MEMFQSILSPVRYATRKGKQVMVGEVYTDYVKPDLCPKITNSRDAFNLLLSDWNSLEHIESFKILLLNRANECVAKVTISVGGVSGTVADPKTIFQKALAANASGIILAHNHPSGNKTASEADISITKKLKECGKFLEIQVLDHVILCGENSYFSFGDEGLM